MDLAFWVIYQSIVHGFCSNMGYFKALRKLLLEWQLVTVTLLLIPEGVTVTADHCTMKISQPSSNYSNRNLASQDLEECLQTYTMPSFCPATAQPESNKSIYLLCLNYALASVNPYTQLTVLPGFWILVQSCNRWSAERAANIFVMLSANHLALSKNMNINQHNLSAFFSKKADRTLSWHC